MQFYNRVEVQESVTPFFDIAATHKKQIQSPEPERLGIQLLPTVAEIMDVVK